jgi:hypothetical protein
MAKKETKNQDQKTAPYTMKDAIKVADDIFKLTKDKEYNIGAFIHGLIFALEYAQHSYKVPQQQIATIKRDCKKYFQDTNNFQKSKD